MARSWVIIAVALCACGGAAPPPGTADAGVGAPDLAEPPRPDGGAPLTIHVDQVVQTLAPEFAGLNFEGRPDWGADISFSAFQRAAFQGAGIQQYRYPGGAMAEWTDLIMTGACQSGGAANYSQPAYTALWSFAVKAGASALLLQTNPTPQGCAAVVDSSGSHAAAIVKDALAHGVLAF